MTPERIALRKPSAGRWFRAALTFLTILLTGCVVPQTRFAPEGAPQGYAMLIGGPSAPEKMNFWITSVGNAQGRIDSSHLSGADTYIGIAIAAGIETVASYRVAPFQGGSDRQVVGPWFTPQAGRCYIAGFYPLGGGTAGNWLPLTPTDRAAHVAWGASNDQPLMREVGREDGLWNHCEKAARIVSGG